MKRDITPSGQAEADIAGMLAPVFCKTNQAQSVISNAFDNVWRIVRGPVVYDDDLDIANGLCQHRLYRLTDIRLMLV
ncbi:hypothetical protein AAAK34_17120 [Ottowia caeni]